MKQIIIGLLAVLFVMPAIAQRQRKSPHDTISTKDISITYGRPYKKDRVIFGELEPFGKVWRVGADEATEITFKKDALFNGIPVKAGTYTLFAIPEATEWTIILNSQLKQWGAYGYEKAKDKNVLQTKVKPITLSSAVEQLTLNIDTDNLVIAWDKTSVTIPVK